MSKTATQIVNMALTLLDEQMLELEQISSTEMSLSEMAFSLLPEVARNLVKDLPYELKKYLAKNGISSLVEETLSNGESQELYSKKKVAFTLPDDFWELVSFKLNCWARPLNSYILIDSEDYWVQNNPFLRGGKQNPVVAVSSSPTFNKFRIECFSVGANDSKAPVLFEYVSFDNVPTDESPWPNELFEKITQALAAKLMQVKGRMDEGAAMGQNTEEALKQHE